ncbi:hypothetical protein CDD83_1497 [Cordyceps sp. RAO-2017]|nr:hypothetical protein CDD83_1497 [Cordyceps sp. RAO-2017]
MPKLSILLELALSLSCAVAGTHAACWPTFVLDGAAEHGFHRAHAPFAIRLLCGKLDAESVAVRVRDAGSGTALESRASSTLDRVVVQAGPGPGPKTITVTARDERRNPVSGSFTMLFGSVDMPVRVVDEQGRPVSGAGVTAVASGRFKQHGVTDSTGAVTLANLPATEIDVFASSAEDGAVSTSLVASPSAITLRLLSPSHLGRLDSVSRDGTVQAGVSAHVARRLSNACQSPTPNSCDFYADCAERALQCGPEGYPLRFGDRNCKKFVSRLDMFSSHGQDWIMKTMSCLQRALIGPMNEDGATCESVKKAAFDSHPNCYIDNGFCDLSLSDLLQVVMTVKRDLFYGHAVDQVMTTAKGCSSHYIAQVKEKLDQLPRSENEAFDDM